MKNILLIESTEDTPRIEFDRGKGLFEISGSSLPENAVKFYQPVKDWLTEYLSNPNPETILSLKCDYYNSATSRQMVDLLNLLEESATEKKSIKIFWYYKKEDEMMYERGLELKEMATIPFEIIEY